MPRFLSSAVARGQGAVLAVTKLDRYHPTFPRRGKEMPPEPLLAASTRRRCVSSRHRTVRAASSGVRRLVLEARAAGVKVAIATTRHGRASKRCSRKTRGPRGDRSDRRVGGGRTQEARAGRLPLGRWIASPRRRWLRRRRGLASSARRARRRIGGRSSHQRLYRREDFTVRRPCSRDLGEPDAPARTCAVRRRPAASWTSRISTPSGSEHRRRVTPRLGSVGQ